MVKAFGIAVLIALEAIAGLVYGQYIIDVLNSTPELSAVAEFQKATGLEIPENSTLFLPNNEAMNSFLEQTGAPNFEALVNSDPDFAAGIQAYSGTKGLYPADDLMDGMVLATYAENFFPNATLVVRRDVEDVYIISSDGSEAKVVAADVPADNYVIHIIDNVLQIGGDMIAGRPNRGLMAANDSKSTETSSNNKFGETYSNQTKTVEDCGTLKNYGMEEVEKHNSRESAWIVYNGFVYDVTSYLDEHPAGPYNILLAAGTDVTEEFDAVHSSKAKQMLEEFCIGKLE